MATKLFEYRKSNKDYLDKPKLHKQVVNKAVLIAKALYLGYLHLFLFDNTTSYAVYADNVLTYLNKSPGAKQTWFCDK